MKKDFYLKSLLLLALMLTGSLAANAHDFEVDGFFYNINGNEATVTYKGTSYSQYSNEYTGNVVIPSSVTYNGSTYSVTSIGQGAFYGCSSLTNVTIPNPVATIGTSAFGNCTGLKSVTIPNSVTTIGYDAFEYCFALTSIDIPNSVITIGEMAFYDCYELKSVTIPESVTTIRNRAFDNCKKLSSVHITDLAAWCRIYFEENYSYPDASYSNPLAYAHKL